MALDVPMIWCMDTWGKPWVEAGMVGAHALMNSGVTHPNNPIQVDSLVLPPGLQSYWSSNVFTVAGTTFNFGFWIRINTANMGADDSQRIISIFTDGGTNPDIEILHVSNYPNAGFDWVLLDANGEGQDSITDPFAEDTWTWCNLNYERHATAGRAVLYVHHAYPSLVKTGVLSTPPNINTEGAGAGTSAQVCLTGHIADAPASMHLLFGGGYFMDGIASPASEVLNHREFHSLRPEKDHVTPDVDWVGGPGVGDDLNLGLWKNLGDRTRVTAGTYSGSGKGGAVQTEDYDFSQGVLDDDWNVGKFVYDIHSKFYFNAANYVYGSYHVDSGVYSVANLACPGSGDVRQFEHVIYSGDAQWPVMTNDPASRKIPVLGFVNRSFTQNVVCFESAFVKMWPKGAPGAPAALHLVNNVPVVMSLVDGGLAR